ncbi:antitoxin VbhA family protein [Bacillus thuringiensis]|uniref:antitoxin VbhA family protein n=1 Tax=Bacillus thuringiensis TaxID=1428 RepID=UPI0021D68662|nr:antitoxin VbhA family protein [Bacillus thuringiensis]MCU7667287.1 antitoxin VbhA family protein [Bacillus thuringiensis]
MTEKEKKVQNALNSLRVEGMELSKEEEENLRAHQDGRIDRNEFIKNAARIAKGENKK